MNDINTCGNHELLVSYLYDECEPAERQSIAAHVAICASCAEELRTLGDVRIDLAAWSPPAPPLGFQITRAESEQPASVLRPAGLASRRSRSEGWWRQPLPAWAQAAAAALIFAAGMSAGAWRSPSTVETALTTTSTAGARASVPVVAPVSQVDFENLEARLLSLERQQARPDSIRLARFSDGVEERELLERAGRMIDARVALSQRENIQLLASVGRSLEEFRAELASRMDEIDAEQQAVRQYVGRGMGSFQTRTASLQSNGR
jgi:hypothetical protein